MATPLSPTTTPADTSARDALIWTVLLERLADADQDNPDPDGQLAALRVLGQVDSADLPIAEITAVLLQRQHGNDGPLVLSSDDDFWTEGLNLIECSPERVPLEPVIAMLRSAFLHDTDTDMMTEFIEKLVGIPHIDPFLALLTDANPVIRRAGLEAMYYLDVPQHILPLLTDPDPTTRALAVENAWAISAITLDQLRTFTRDDQPQEVRDQAHADIARYAADQT